VSQGRVPLSQPKVRKILDTANLTAEICRDQPLALESRREEQFQA
jgi:hypothetical protein